MEEAGDDREIETQGQYPERTTSKPTGAEIKSDIAEEAFAALLAAGFLADGLPQLQKRIETDRYKRQCPKRQDRYLP